MIRVDCNGVEFDLESPEVYLTTVHVMGTTKSKYRGWYHAVCPHFGEYSGFPIHLEKRVKDARAWCEANGLIVKEYDADEED